MKSNKIVAGYSRINTTNDFAVARYNISDGSLDTTFDGDGKLTTPVGTQNDVGNAIAIQTDGKILVADSTETAAGVNNFAVVRYNANGSLDSSLAFANPDSFSNPFDQLFGSGGKTVVDLGGNDTANAIALDSSGRVVIAGEANGLFGIARLQADYVPTAAAVSISGRVGTPDGRGLINANVELTDYSGKTRIVRTSAFGYFRFTEVEAGQNCIISVSSKRYGFTPKLVAAVEDLTGLIFVAAK